MWKNALDTFSLIRSRQITTNRKSNKLTVAGYLELLIIHESLDQLVEDFNDFFVTIPNIGTNIMESSVYQQQGDR